MFSQPATDLNTAIQCILSTQANGVETRLCLTKLDATTIKIQPWRSMNGANRVVGSHHFPVYVTMPADFMDMKSSNTLIKPSIEVLAALNQVARGSKIDFLLGE